MKKFILLLISLIGCLYTYACICPDWKKIDVKDINENSLAFEGVVIACYKNDSLEECVFLMKIEKKHFGNIATDTIRLTAPISAGFCGLRIEVNQRWFIFLPDSGYKNVTLCDRAYHLSTLSGRMKASKYEREKLKKYNKQFHSDRKFFRKQKS